MIYTGLELFNDAKELSFRVCHVCGDQKRVALADMNVALEADNPKKPVSYGLSELDAFIKKNELSKRQYELPAEFSFSDKQLKKAGYQLWLDKRDIKHNAIKPLLTEALIDKYLYYGGLHDEISTLLPGSTWKSPGSFINALNRYLTFGQVPNALLSFKRKNIGTNSLIPKTPECNGSKRGPRFNRCDKTKECRSKTRGVTQQDKKQILKIAAMHKQNEKKFAYKKLFEEFNERFQQIELIRNINGIDWPYYFAMNEEDTINRRQFYYHIKKMFNRDDLLKMQVGHIAHEKDHVARQGSSIDGVIGATHRYEIDATVLDVYVRYPYDNSGRYSMGRPVLYIVVDVYSTMVCGFFLGFDGPNSDGAGQALVNACMNKVEFAKRYGVHLAEDDWPACHVPGELTIDNGTEYPNGLISSILKSKLGVKAVNLTAVYRGDAKGCVESKFNVLNNEKIHFLPGSIFKETDRTEQHPSNRALYDYDELVRELIYTIVENNHSAERLKRHNFQAVVDDIGLSPHAIFCHSLKTEMDDGRPTSTEDESRVRWAFLKEEEAVVRDDCIYFDGLEYHSDYFSKAGLYQRAKHHGRFKIVVKRVKDWVNHIFHQTESGQFVKLTLKNVNNESPYWNQTWESVLHLQEWQKDKVVEHQRWRQQFKAHLKSIKKPEYQKLLAELDGLPENTRKSIIPGIKEHKEIQKLLNAATHARDVLDALGLSEVGMHNHAHSKSTNIAKGFA